MTTEYRTVYEGGEGEIVEKKSRFIAAVKPVSAEDDALAFIESVKKKHWNATHNCFAYVIGERSELARCSDDGEPNGTAGKPMLDVLQGEELRNTAVVVTRYFGGTLLGTGGLVRAYSQAVKAGLASSVIITKIRGVKLRIGTDYTGLGKIQYILGQKGLKILDSVYTDSVKLEVLVPEDAVVTVRSDITEGTNGQASMEEGERCWFAQIDGQPVVLEEFTD
ncbi:YigZ family protein [Extibacter muris]|uniref:YigZ family protein n=1 Tax=Extibacter muris TaxID=1796622 RepID=UPI001D06213F|nr:YigZ family protein [Extibacter muris]MCB6200924.1 YigZ family protein [Extibacter muris]MCQ4662254.1 YigZ family protein [Extibacter muris]MCQ4691832.1 YigZ family protein [Extibacter muris]